MVEVNMRRLASLVTWAACSLNTELQQTPAPPSVLYNYLCPEQENRKYSKLAIRMITWQQLVSFPGLPTAQFFDHL